MATWKSENTMLTQVGVEILNKLKAGVGSISNIRVVAGSARVDESQLFYQTDVSGEQLNLIVSDITTHGTGSEISAYITNEELIAPYPIHQIGVYVTHPDYEGEQLYHISQCEIGDFDTMPAFEDTPGTQGYTIFLEHGNSSSVQITVDPQGMLRRDVFDKFIENAVVGNLFTIDENKNLVDTGVPVSMLGTSSKNLLHNWYLRNPINTKSGRIAVAGTPYFSNTALTTQVGTLTTAYEATYVTGNYSTITIDGTTYYVRTNAIKYGYLANSSGIPCYDRWVLSKGNGSGNVVREYEGSILTLGYGNGQLTQRLDVISNASHFGGHTYTFSAKIISVTGGTPVLMLDNGETSLEVPITKTGIVAVTAYVAEDAGSLTVGIRNKHLSENSVIQVVSAKLEVGNASTLENDPPADYAEQMAICIQFDPSSDMYRGFTSLYTANILADATLTE